MKNITIKHVYFKVAEPSTIRTSCAQQKSHFSLQAVVAVQVIFISIYAFTIQKHKIGRKVHDGRELKIYMACRGRKRRFFGIILKTLKTQTGTVGQMMTSMDLQGSDSVGWFTKV